MPSLKEQILQNAEKKGQTIDDPSKNTTQNEPDPQNRSKDANLGNLRKAIEERDNELQSLRGEIETLKQSSTRLTDEKFKPLWSTLESEYEDNPEKLVEELKTLKTTSSEWETKLKEKEALLERAAFEKSEAYVKNVAGPITNAENLLKGVVKKDENLYRTLLKNFVYDKEGKVIQGGFSAEDVIALDEALESVDGIKAERVQTAIENLREKFHAANAYNNEFKTRLQQEDEARQVEIARRNKEQADMAKIARGAAIKVGVGKFASNETLKKVFGDEFMGGIGRVVATSVESMIESRQLPTMEAMAENQIKALLWDQLQKEGGLDILAEAIESSLEHSGAGVGTRGDSRAPQKKETRSVREILAEKAGLDRRFS